jgi:hypothetical protein
VIAARARAIGVDAGRAAVLKQTGILLDRFGDLEKNQGRKIAYIERYGNR